MWETSWYFWYFIIRNLESFTWASQVALVVKNPPDNAGDIRDETSIPESGRSPGEGHGNPLQYSCLENIMSRGAWLAVVYWVAKSWIWLKQQQHTHTHTLSLSLSLIWAFQVASGKESVYQCRRHRRCRFDPWVRTIPWSRKWQLTPVFVPGEFQGQRSLVGTIYWFAENWHDLATEHACIFQLDLLQHSLWRKQTNG